MATEGKGDQISRVELMAAGSDTWDLSDNDRAALTAVLDDRSALLDVVHSLCLNLACAGVEAKEDSHNPLESLHAAALTAHLAATGDGNPFATEMAAACAANRAALAKEGK